MATSGYVFKDSGLTPPADNQRLENPISLPQNRMEHQTHAHAVQSADTHARPETLPQHGQTETETQLHTQNIPNSSNGQNDVTLIQEKTEILRKTFVADSHELAQEPPEIEGAVQSYPGGESKMGVRDIGWHKSGVEIPDPLIGGLSNGRLFAMIRRFNKEVFAVKSVPVGYTSSLDLNEAWSPEYMTDKLALHLQRIYLSIVLDLASLAKQISRLRSWNEVHRTSAFCAAYFVAWLLDLLVPLILGVLILVVSSTAVRDVLFPSSPRALVNLGTGGLQKPPAGQLGTIDSLTGAPEKQPGEAVEEEAANFVDNLRHLVQRAVGMHGEGEEGGDPLEGLVPKPIRTAVKAVTATGSSPGHVTGDSDPTQRPMEEVLWTKVKPEVLAPILKDAPHMLGEVVDNWERFANAIAPTPPFTRYSFVRIDAVIVPLFLASFFVSSYMVTKGAGFAIGFGIFGKPVLTPALEWLNRNYPNWIELLEPKNNILRGVPTNRQLALTLLRIGEVHNTPLPPVPRSKPDDPDRHSHVDLDKIPLEASRREKVRAIEPLPTEKRHPESNAEDQNNGGPPQKRMSRIARLFKSTTKSAVETKLAVDHVRAAAGSERAKGHLGVLASSNNLIYAGPSHFKARFRGKNGWVFITESANPYLSFTTHDPRQNGDAKEKLDPVFEIAVKDIQQLKRAAAFSSKPAEMMVNMSCEEELLGSVEIEDKNGKIWRLTALPERDELFNRLVAIGNQRWENL